MLITLSTFAQYDEQQYAITDEAGSSADHEPLSIAAEVAVLQDLRPEISGAFPKGNPQPAGSTQTRYSTIGLKEEVTPDDEGRPPR
jgi:hypothetical protein